MLLPGGTLTEALNCRSADGGTLEWTAESPPPHGNWSELPNVYRGPYEYSVPGREDDYYPQNVPG